MTSTQQANLHYWRKDITGLRAVAVLPVLLYHAFPTLLPGGFFGVDIFFVISGYLISGIIFRVMLNDSFSYKDFYIKRIKRILPNLCTLLIAVAAVGWFLLAKPELSALGKHIYSSAFFYQNFRLLGEGDYFAVASHESRFCTCGVWQLKNSSTSSSQSYACCCGGFSSTRPLPSDCLSP